MKKIFPVVIVLLFISFAFGQSYTIQQYLNIKSAGSPTFSPDGKRIAYLTNVTGTSQVWVIDLPNGTPKRLTNYDDNVSFVRWLGDGSGLIFGKAIGGDENTQFFWMKPDGSGVRALTDEPKVRHNFGLVSEDSDVIAYASNKRDKNYFDIYAMDIATGKEVLLYQQDGNNDIATLSPDGKKIIVSRDGTELSLDNNLYLVDLKTKHETLLTPHAGASEFGDVHFTADGLVFTTDDSREFSGLAQLRQKNAAGDDWSDNNREVQMIDSPDWDVNAVEMTDYPSVMAYTVNRDGFSEVHLRQVETDGKPLITTVADKQETVKLPARGIVGGLTFSKDQKKLAFTFNAAKYNTDIWMYDLASKKLTQVTKSDRAGIPQTSFVEPKLIKFKTFDGREVPAWYYEPNRRLPARSALDSDKPRGINAKANQTNKEWRMEDVSAFGPKPSVRTIVSVHGGPEGQERPGFNALYQYYLSRGYAILATNVRGSTGYGKTYTHLDDVKNRENSVKDLAYAVEWLKTQGGADPKRIAVMGGSYGGYMTLAAITLYPDLWAAAVDTVGIANWESFLKNTSGYRRRQREVEYGMLDKDIDFLRSISPIAKVDRIKTPLFVIAGKNDPRVPYTEAEQMVGALRKRGATVEYKLYDDEGHGVAKLKNRLELYPLVADFLDKYMK